MRIIAGQHKGRRLNTPSNTLIRPTSDKVRQAIFNALYSRGALDNARVLDGFCGTGALGLEALSQGAEHCVFFDKNRASLNLCRDNIALLKEEENTHCVIHDTTKPLQRPEQIKPIDLVFLDPPYGKNMVEQAIETLKTGNWLDPDCWFVLETGKDEVINASISIDDEKHYGDTKIIFAQMKA